jgi:hypothetical protein
LACFVDREAEWDADGKGDQPGVVEVIHGRRFVDAGMVGSRPAGMKKPLVRVGTQRYLR